ncbi:GNAT family N-acetyltransferase [Mesoflavibacter zeaxanthinifaciens]|uniref:GNAT family N-acetyltransferase n=1 Tax=Mesoflavibacter zeaxanthinifaciens TaxID=393060 RepID=UPI003A923D5C
MTIKRLTVNDASSITNLIKSTNFEYSELNNSNSGFLLYNYGEDNYKERLKQYSHYSFGCFEGDNLVGCVLAYPLKFLKENNEFVAHESLVFNELLSLKNQNMVWGEQIAILPNKRRKLYGKLLMRKIYDKMKDDNLLYFSCMVSLFPNLNKAGVNFLNSEKYYHIFKTVEENGTVWGLFLSSKILFEK